MKVKATAGNPDIATVYLAEVSDGKYIEFVESLQPPIPLEKKWVMIVSTLYGCPVGCAFCDAGGWYEGKLSTEEILTQIDYMVVRKFPNRIIPVEKFKIQFARMGEPAFNKNVLDVLEALPLRYQAPGLMPSISTVAPDGTDSFFERLPQIKDKYYSNGRFQMQFSIHSTNEQQRDKLIPVKKWNFQRIAQYGESFFNPKKSDRKITLNFALAENTELDIHRLMKYFNPDIFMIKITPVNPTVSALRNDIVNHVKGDDGLNEPKIAGLLRETGYEVIVSIGEWEENKIGSNCGQYIKRFLESGQPLTEETYQYKLETISQMPDFVL
jgi:23S rRNA (adenine2503-C2)-methyltransferase